MTSLFERALKPPTPRTRFVDPSGSFSLEGLSQINDLWQWVVSGFVVFPCDTGGTANAIELTPRFRPEIVAGGYAHLLPYSFVAASTNTAAATIEIIGRDGRDLAALPVYVGAVAAVAGQIVAGSVYVVFYCEATNSLPERMVLK